MSTIELDELAADADAKARRQQVRRQELADRYQQIAADKVWYTGTGNADQVMPHQWQAMCFGAVARRFLLADKMGLGKTRSAIGWMDLVQAKRVVLVALRNVAPQFAGEIEDIAPHRKIFSVVGLDSDKRLAVVDNLLKWRQDGILVINFDLLRLDPELFNRILKWQPDTVVVDEAHTIKKASTSTFKAVQKLIFTDNKCEQCGGLIFSRLDRCKACQHQAEPLGKEPTLERYLSTQSVKNVCMMTGTPLLNTPLDLYSLLHLIAPDKFRSETAFKKAFCKPDFVDGSRKLVFKRNGLELLHPYIKNFYLARTVEDVGERVEGGIMLPNGQLLPDQRKRVIRVKLDREKYPLQARTIEQVSNQAKIMLSTGEKATLMHIITIILRKRQANVWPGGITFKDTNGEVIFRVGQEVQESCKLDACQEEILAYHKGGHRQVVFSQFKEALIEFEQRLTKAGLRVARFDGDTPAARREAIKNNFYRAKNETPKWDVVLVHYKSGGTGLNLTAATVTHEIDEAWNAGTRDQGHGRTHRIGQTEASEVITYRIPGTVDTWMAALIAQKEKMANDLHNTMTNNDMLKSIRQAILKGDM